MSSDCLFCRIVAGEIPAAKVVEESDFIAFTDVAPQAPLHVLFVPRRHIATLNDLQSQDAELIGRIVLGARAHALDRGIAEDGYRLFCRTNLKKSNVVSGSDLDEKIGRHGLAPP